VVRNFELRIATRAKSFKTWGLHLSLNSENHKVNVDGLG
jgi:hypothetical protein